MCGVLHGTSRYQIPRPWYLVPRTRYLVLVRGMLCTGENIPNSSCLILSDYGLGVLNDQGAERLISVAKKHNVPIIADPKLTGLHRTHGVDWVLFQSKGLELMRRRLGAATGAEAATLLLESNDWKHLLILEGQDGVTIHSRDAETVHVQCMLEEIRQMIGLIDAAAVAVAEAVAATVAVALPLAEIHVPKFRNQALFPLSQNCGVVHLIGALEV